MQEVELWQTVILQVFRDASVAIPSTTPKKQLFLTKRRHHAIWWLTSNNADFNEVCGNAQVNPDVVMDRAIKRYGRRYS